MTHDGRGCECGGGEDGGVDEEDAGVACDAQAAVVGQVDRRDRRADDDLGAVVGREAAGQRVGDAGQAAADAEEDGARGGGGPGAGQGPHEAPVAAAGSVS